MNTAEEVVAYDCGKGGSEALGSQGVLVGDHCRCTAHPGALGSPAQCAQPLACTNIEQ